MHIFFRSKCIQILALKIKGEVSTYGNSPSDERHDVSFIALVLAGTSSMNLMDLSLDLFGCKTYGRHGDCEYRTLFTKLRTILLRAISLVG